MVFIADSMNVIPVSTDYPESDKPQGPLQPRRFCQVDPEPVTPALISAGHFCAGVAKLFLDETLIHLGR